MSVNVKKAEFDQVTPGKYNATFNSSEIINTQFGEAIRWTFVTVSDDPKFNGLQVSGLTDIKATPKNKTTRWLKAVGIEPTKEGVDLDLAIGKQVVITVEQKGEYSNVTTIENPAVYTSLTR